MSSTSVARSGHAVPTPEAQAEGDLEHVGGIAARVLRGQQLYREHAEDFVYRNGAWIVASDTVPGRTYEVRLGPAERCECADFEHRGGRCKHITAASIAQAKSRVCSCCGQRVLSRFTTEVTEEDGLLSWYPGDVICADCKREGFWA